MEPHLSAPYRKAIRKRYSTCSRAPFKSTSNNARSRNINGAYEKPKNANRSCVMNKCAASAFQAAGIIYGLRLLRAAYCDEQMGAAHKAIVTADMTERLILYCTPTLNSAKAFGRKNSNLQGAMDERIYRDSGRTYCNKRTFFNARDSSTPSTAEQTPRGITRKAGV